MRHAEVVVLEEAQRLAPGDIVELVDEEDVGVGALDDLGDGIRLRVARRRQVADQRALRTAVERGVERGEPDVARGALAA